VAIGKTVGIHPDYIKLDFGYAIKGILLAQAFLNSTKRNRPKVNIGDFLLCRIIRVGDVVFVSCCEEGLGVLEGGWVFEIEAWAVKTLFVRKNILSDIGRDYKYKVALGLNGMIWIDGKNVMVVKNVRDEINKRVKSLIE
ncbi:Exosomal 3'-5' exoribonuclease complex subunit Rrp40, partial [Trachipleistophora hominis]